MPTWTPKSASSLSYLDLAEPEGVIEREIILAISNLGNSILANNASRTLARLKARHRQHFADVTLFVRAIELLGDFYLRLPIRRYIWELFDIKLDQDVVSDLQAARNALVEKKRRRIADDELARRQQGQGGSGSGSSRFRTLPLTAARRRSGRRAANANGRTGAGGAGLKGAPFGGGRGLADNEIVTEDEMDSDVEGGGVGPPTEDDEGLDADADADADMDLDGDLDPEMDGDGDGDGDGAAADDSDEYLSLPHHPTGAGGAGGRGGASATPGVYFEPRKRVLGFGFAGSGPAREREGTGNADADAGAGAGAGAGASQAQAVPA